MSKHEHPYNKHDLYPSGKAYRSSIFGPGESSFQQNHPYPVNPPHGSYIAPNQTGGQQASPFGNVPFKDIKGFIDRMGGIDGIMSLLNKVNAMVKTFQQMAPMLRLVVGSFSQAKTTDHQSDHYAYSPKKRRRRKRRKSKVSSYPNPYRSNSTGRKPIKRRSRQRSL